MGTSNVPDFDDEAVLDLQENIVYGNLSNDKRPANNHEHQNTPATSD